MIKTLPPRRRRSSSEPEQPMMEAGESKGSAMDLNEIKRLIQLVQKSGIGELEVTEGGRTIRISASPVVAPAGPAQYVYSAPPGPAAPAAAPVAPAPAVVPVEAVKTDAHLVPVVSPMVGTFYRSPAPDADPYVESNSSVEIVNWMADSSCLPDLARSRPLVAASWAATT